MITMSVGEELQLRFFFGCSLTLLLFSITSIVVTEQTDRDVWGRPPIAHVNGGYEGVIVAIHKNVPQDRLLLNKTKEAINKTSQNLYDATGKFFREVVILIPSSWNMASYMTSNEIKFAEGGEEYERSHLRIRSSHEISIKDIGDFSSYSSDSSDSPCDDDFVVLKEEASEPFVHQPGKCGEESAFIGVTPEFMMNSSSWGEPAKALVHLWGHFRWGLFDEYHHSPFNCTDDLVPTDKQNYGRCSRGIRNEYKKKTVGDSHTYDGITLREVCSNSGINVEVHTVNPEYVTGSIMSVSSNKTIGEFCHNSPNKSSSSKHTGNAFNQQNRMCQRRSSWEVMEQHSDFANDNKTVFEEPTFILMIRKIIRKLVLTDSTDTISQSCGMLPYSDECYILRSLALSDSSGNIGIVDGENNYFLMNAEFEMEVDMNSPTDPRVEISEVIFFENASNSLINRFFNSTMDMNFTKCTFVGDDFKTFAQLHQCQHSTVSEYLENIHYDDLEEFVRVLSVEGTINETSYSQELDFTLDCGIDEKFTMLLLRWDNGNMAILGSSLQTVYISETLIEKRINEEAFNVGDNVPFTLKKTGPETVRFTLEVFSKASVSDYDVEPVRVRPYLKSSSVVSDCDSAITLYTSVTQNDKPILGAEVVAKVSSSDGSRFDMVLKDSNLYEVAAFEDGIYSANFSPFKGSGNYTIDVKAKGVAGQTTWNVEGLQPSGILPDIISVRKLLSKPFTLQKNFERSPRSISLEAHCQDLSTVPYSTHVETTFLDETSQTTRRLISEGFTTPLEKETDVSITVSVPDETTTFDTQTSKGMSTVPFSTLAVTTVLHETSQETEVFTPEVLKTSSEKKTDVSTTELVSDETTTAAKITFNSETRKGRSTVSFSSGDETTFEGETSQTTEFLASTTCEEKTDVSTDMLTRDETTAPVAAILDTQTTKGEDLTTSREKSTRASTTVLTSDKTTTPFYTTFDWQTTKVPTSAYSETTYINGMMQTTELSTSEELTTSREKRTRASTTVLISDKTTTPFDTTFDLQTTKGLSTLSSSSSAETTFLGGTNDKAEFLTSEVLTTSTETKSTTELIWEDTTIPFGTTFDSQITKEPKTEISTTYSGSTTFDGTSTQSTEHVRVDEVTLPTEMSTDRPTSMLRQDDTTTPPETTVGTQTTTAAVTSDAHTTDFDSTTKDISKCTTRDALTKPSVMKTYSSFEIFATSPMSSTPPKLPQLSITTAGKIPLMTSTTEGSSPSIQNGSICRDDIRWICIFVPTVTATIFFWISYLIVYMFKSKRMLRYSVDDREKGMLGFRTNEKAPKHALKDVEMQDNSLHH